jgi:spore coat-associated protein N
VNDQTGQGEKRKKRGFFSLREMGMMTAAAGLLLAGMVAFTSGYFSDAEASSDNTITAGTLDLTVNGGNVDVTAVTISNVAPGDTNVGNLDEDDELIPTDRIALVNVGSLPGELNIKVLAIRNIESTGDTEYEQDGGDGELGANTQLRLWIDRNNDGIFDDGDDVVLLSDGTFSTAMADFDTAWAMIDDYLDAEWLAGGNEALAMAAAAAFPFVIEWQVPFDGDLSTVDDIDINNSFQGDSVEVDLEFVLQQVFPTP